MRSIHEILTHDNAASSSRAKEYIGVLVLDKDNMPLNGEVTLSDGTIARFRDGLLDGNIYSKDGAISKRFPALEYDNAGTEYWTDGAPEGWQADEPAVIQNWGTLMEYWKNGNIMCIKNEVQLEEIVGLGGDK